MALSAQDVKYQCNWQCPKIDHLGEESRGTKIFRLITSVSVIYQVEYQILSGSSLSDMRICCVPLCNTTVNGMCLGLALFVGQKNLKMSAWALVMVF